MSSSPSRRVFGGLLGSAATAAALGTAASPAAGRPAETPFRAAPERSSRRPNILFILGDDLGWADLSSYGSPHIRTPHLDRLARQGVRFTQAYAGSATCSPTRFSLYTGRYPGRTAGGLAEPIADTSAGLEPGHPTLASLLRDAGYDTALIGKWHCGFLPHSSPRPCEPGDAPCPTRSGWDSFFGNFGGALAVLLQAQRRRRARPLRGRGRLSRSALPELMPSAPPFRVELKGILALAVRRGAAPPLKSPCPTMKVAGPTAGRAESDACGGPCKTDLPGDRQGPVKQEPTVVLRSSADRNLLSSGRRGRQYTRVLTKRAVRHTRVRGERPWLLNLNFTTPHWPWITDGDEVESAEIARWPARLDGGQVSHVPLYSPDWTATLLELGGARPAASHPLDGRSLAGYLLRGGDPPGGDLFWRARGERALRRGDWKYHRGEDGADHLFDLAHDPRERADKASVRPGLLARLRTAWEETDAGLLPYPAQAAG